MPFLENGSLDPSKPLNLDEYLFLSRMTPEDSTYSVNKHILKILGPLYAVYLTNLMETQQEKAENENLEYYKPFKLSHKEQKEKTGLTEYEIRKSKAFLKKLKILFINRKGVPSKEYYQLNYKEIENLFRIDNKLIAPKEEKKPEIIKLKNLIGRKK
jgi:hypothetical protein